MYELVEKLYDHCLGDHEPSAELMSNGKFPKNWVSKYLGLLERVASVHAGKPTLPSEAVAAILFASW